MRTRAAYLDERQQQSLLAWARQAIARAVHAGDGAAGGSLPDEPVFREKRAAFVTLTRNGRAKGLWLSRYSTMRAARARPIVSLKIRRAVLFRQFGAFNVRFYRQLFSV